MLLSGKDDEQCLVWSLAGQSTCLNPHPPPDRSSQPPKKRNQRLLCSAVGIAEVCLNAQVSSLQSRVAVLP